MTANNNPWAKENLKKIVAAIHHYSATDKEFRDLCIKEPNKAVEKIAGAPVPSEVKIRFVESDPKADMTYLLPDFVTDDELDDNELAQVSGGRGEAVKDTLTPIVNAGIKPAEMAGEQAGKII